MHLFTPVTHLIDKNYRQYQRWGWKVDLIEKTQTRPLMSPIQGLPEHFDVEQHVYRFGHCRLSTF